MMGVTCIFSRRKGSDACGPRTAWRPPSAAHRKLRRVLARTMNKLHDPIEAPRFAGSRRATSQRARRGCGAGKLEVAPQDSALGPGQHHDGGQQGGVHHHKAAHAGGHPSGHGGCHRPRGLRRWGQGVRLDLDRGSAFRSGLRFGLRLGFLALRLHQEATLKGLAHLSGALHLLSLVARHHRRGLFATLRHLVERGVRRERRRTRKARVAHDEGVHPRGAVSALCDGSDDERGALAAIAASEEVRPWGPLGVVLAICRLEVRGRVPLQHAHGIDGLVRPGKAHREDDEVGGVLHCRRAFGLPRLRR
mmetsp:Transcript_30316/g.87416  ORF Transcript_30316/g.87416 Transcript_30316/m.87416 type:complete len:306 (+) Transcript_30316:330-1247(+)